MRLSGWGWSKVIGDEEIEKCEGWMRCQVGIRVNQEDGKSWFREKGIDPSVFKIIVTEGVSQILSL